MSPVDGMAPAARRAPARRRVWLLVALAYVALLAASHFVRALRASTSTPTSSARVATIGDGVAIAYSDEGRPAPAGDAPAALPVLLIHGSPGDRSNFADLSHALSGARRTIAPDLPGFGESTADVPDYSIAAHAEDVLELLDALQIERVHVVGFSMGGGVALELAGQAPERVASIVMLSAIGVQELELLGDYHLNHAVHGAQLAGLFVAHELLPHFGLFDGGMLSLAYARNFYDTDQRPLRDRLEAFEAPMLIVHGKGDVLVPFAAAQEHHRIVPQSELIEFDANHFMVFRRADELAAAIEPFLSDVERGVAATRGSADPARSAAARAPFDASTLEPVSGFALATLLVLIALATLVSEDLTCIGVGALVAQGRVELLPGVAACFVGIYVGDLMLFLAGRFLGRRAVGRAPLKWFLSEARVEASSRWFDERGGRVIFLSRFLPGMRLPTYFVAGVLRTSFLRFSLWFALAALLWTPLLVWLASRIGGALTERVELLQKNLALGLVATVVVGLVFVKLVRPMTSDRGRRLLRASIGRKLRWEYWPRWLFYPPIVLACAWHGIRRGRPLAFTAVNPSMPHGGFVGESKADILDGFRVRRDLLARTLVLAPNAAPDAVRARVEAFQGELDAAWPLIVKPDVGQRGDGVSLVRSLDELERACAALNGRVLVQEYVDGVEFGLFYVRHPDAEHGTLLSITRKVLPEVIGDGGATLEQLILRDPRAVLSAEAFLTRHAARLTSVPAAGECVRLGDLGTHSRGAAFLEGIELLTPELAAAVDELSLGYDGFHFGRYDVRAASDDALRAGRFRVLELNGVTSESAHIYDPRYSVLYGWKTLAAQWRLAYDIGLANAERGARISTAGELVRAFRAYRSVATGASA